MIIIIIIVIYGHAVKNYPILYLLYNTCEKADDVNVLKLKKKDLKKGHSEDTRKRLQGIFFGAYRDNQIFLIHFYPCESVNLDLNNC